jgi:hypothetical protein
MTDVKVIDIAPYVARSDRRHFSRRGEAEVVSLDDARAEREGCATGPLLVFLLAQDPPAKTPFETNVDRLYELSLTSMC